MTGRDDSGSDRLTILHVSEVTTGGVLTLLRHFIPEQGRLGHDVHLLSPSDMPVIEPARAHAWRIRRTRPWTLFTALRDLRRTVRSVRPDVVHVHSFIAGFVARLPGLGGSWRRTTAVVYQPHAWSFDLFASRAFGWALRRFERSAAARTDLLVANCQDEIDEGRTIGVDLPARVLGVAVDVDMFRPVAPDQRIALRRALGVRVDRRMAVCLGRLARQKGQDLLLAEWEEHRPPSCDLYLVGPGDQAPLRAVAQTQWGSSVHAVGETPEVISWLGASDVMVLPSRYETVGLVVAEALACGIPVVATAFNGAHEVIDAGPHPAGGAVVAVGDMSGMVDELERRLDDDGLLGAESKAARIRAEAMFDPPGLAGRLDEAYRTAIRSHHEKDFA